jgi:hypothetical protein
MIVENVNGRLINYRSFLFFIFAGRHHDADFVVTPCSNNKNFLIASFESDTMFSFAAFESDASLAATPFR